MHLSHRHHPELAKSLFDLRVLQTFAPGLCDGFLEEDELLVDLSHFLDEVFIGVSILQEAIGE